MNYLLFKPKQILSEYIKCIWSLEHINGPESFCIQKLMPVGCIECVFSYTDKIGVQNSRGEKITLPYGSISGQKMDYTNFWVEGNTGIISVLMQPAGTKAILGIPLNELENLYVGADDVFGKEGKIICDKIAEAKNMTDRVTIIEDFFEKKIIENNIIPDNRLVEAVRIITVTGGNVRIDELAKNVFISKRQLERIFSQEIGIRPKDFSKIIRFQKVLSIKQQNNNMNLTTLAIDSGYADQAHFIKDFKSISGYTPKEYFRQEPAFSDYYTYL